jgi:O-antigen/teichoic acid export membrane protein
VSPLASPVGAKVLSALRWSATTRLIGQAVTWTMTIFVIRLLSPADYGVLAMAVILPAVLYFLNDLGLDVVLVQRQAGNDTIFRRQVFGVVIVINLLCALILVASAPLVAAFFREPILVPILKVLSLQFLLLVFETLPRTRLEQGLNFRSQSLISLGAGWLGGLTTLVLASSGWGVWSLVWGRLVSTAASTVALNVIAPSLCLPSFSLDTIRHALSFGGIVTLERGAWQLFSDADKVIGGRLWSDATLGLYSVAQDLATMPMNRAGGLIASIGLPAFSQMQDRMEDVRFYLLKAVRIISVLSFPLFIGLAVTAPEAVAVLLGPKWPAAAPLLQVLALIMPLRMVATLLPPALWSIGRPGISAGNVLIAALVIPWACLIGAQWGAMGMAIAWLAAFPVVFAITLQRSGGPLGLRVPDFGRAMRAPTLASGVMAVAVIGARYLMPDEAGAAARLLMLVPAGAVSYLVALLLLERTALRETAQLVGR